MRYTRNIQFVLFGLIMFGFIWPAFSFAEAENEVFEVTAVIAGKMRSASTFSSGQSMEGEDRQKYNNAYILAKTKGNNINERYEIVEKTTGFDQRGKPLSIDRFPAPSEALLRYQRLSTGGKNVLEMVLIRTLPGASPAWQVPLPE